ncbi:replication protein RepA [Burkholderia plantarii]|uniref:replication protein RepA n=1 Tax=Burkholderia plantarii TaxID=41899 RepID=UPI0006D8B1BD|nr:replication protein RepA [Burkholderia plantarii]ALK35149.1 RepA replicase protein [Burkholderia plantarii]GLZ22489.1 plasmid replication protein [Burkholderia plantarii]
MAEPTKLKGKSSKSAEPKSAAIRPNVASRLFEESLAIEREDAFRAGMAGFMGRALVQATLPYREPDRDLPVWGRRSGEMSLIIKPGYYLEQKSNQLASMGYPYGTIPRLLLAWLGTEAVRTKERQLVLGKSLSAFMDALGISAHTGGKNGSITRVREMMKRLFASDMAIVHGGGPAPGTDFATRKFSIADETCLWWDPQAPEQAGLWQSTVTLSERFFREILEAPVPIDLRALKALRQSPMAIDLYCWLTYRNFSLRAPTTVPWEALKLQFGSGASEDKKFRETVRRALVQVLEVYPAANVSPTKAGLYLEPSRTSVPRAIKIA